jgi:HEAT repeat protein
MSALPALLLGLGVFMSAAGAPDDVALLREMLQDRQHPRNQSQAALLLVENTSPDAEEVVRQGLRQTEAPDVFLALAAALRLRHDDRFTAELLAGLSSGRQPVRDTAAETLAELADADVIRSLRRLALDAQADPAARQAAVTALGRSGQKAAAQALVGLVTAGPEAVRRPAVEALEELSGQSYGLDPIRWRRWWEARRGLSDERWLQERLAYQRGRSRRVEGDLERARAQIVRLQQQLHDRLPAADRLSHVQAAADADDPAVRALAVAWSLELYPTADAVGKKLLIDLWLRLSHDGAVEVQRLAVLALGRVDDVRTFHRLRELLQYGRPPVRAAAARALAQQASGSAAEPRVRPSQVIPALQKALDDPAIEVVVEVAEDLGTLGVPEAGPVLAALLRNPSEPVRLAAAQALERTAEASILDSLLDALNDASAAVRFSLVGALGHAAGDGGPLTARQTAGLVARLEELLAQDPDPGVRSRAAMVLGERGSRSVLPALWKRVQSAEDARVQEKAWQALLAIVARSGSLDLVHEWDHTLAEAKQGPRRLQLLSEVAARWKNAPPTKAAARTVLEDLVQVQLDQGKWAAALPVVHELLAQAGADADTARRLRWLLAIGTQALREGNRAEALHAVQEARPWLARQEALAAEFDKLEKQAR